MSGFVDAPREGRPKRTWSWECAQCGTIFQRVPMSRNDPKYCSNHCYQAWAASPGGSRLTVGHKKTKTAPIGTVSIVHRKGKKGPRAVVKTADGWKERAKVVWEAYHGREVPKGSVVHHKDRNSINDDIDNLEVMTRSEHAREHKNEICANRMRGCA